MQRKGIREMRRQARCNLLECLCDLSGQPLGRRVSCHLEPQQLPPAVAQTRSTSSRIDKYRGTMRLGQERIDFVALPVECQRVRACFRRHHFLAAHRANIDDVYYPGIADGYVKAPGLRMQENYVRDAAKGNFAAHTTRSCVNCEQHASIAGAQ